MTSARPRVTLKLASSLDGRIAARGGISKWITGAEARDQVHRLRAEHGAILVGAATARADDPDLRVRLEGWRGAQPMRAVLDPRLTLSPDSHLAKTARQTPVIVFAAPRQASAALEDAGVTVETVTEKAGGLNVEEALDRLAHHGAESVMVEGGGKVAAAFVRAGLVDRIEWFRAPILLGAEGVPAMGDLGVESPDHAPRFTRESVTALGDDVWERYVRASEA